MGTDITVCLETLVNGKWTFVKELECFRSYQMFSLLAGVRNHYKAPPLVGRRGEYDIAPETDQHMLNIGTFGYFYCLQQQDVLNYEHWDDKYIDDRNPEEFLTPRSLLVDWLAEMIDFVKASPNNRAIFEFDS